MNDEMRIRLEIEQSKGRIASNVASSVEPYFSQVKENLLDSFLNASPCDGETHMAIRRQIEAVDAIWSLIKTDVETGTMATKTLEKHNEH
jgi:hypothetical protein